MILLLLPLFSSVAWACAPFNTGNLPPLTVTVSNIDYVPLAWANSNPNAAWGWSDFSTGSGTAMSKINSMIADMLYAAAKAALPKSISAIPGIMDKISFQVTCQYPIINCDDVQPSMLLQSTIRPTVAGMLIPNRTCMVSGDHLIMGICKNTDPNCTLIRNNLPGSTDKLIAFATVNPTTVDPTGGLYSAPGLMPMGLTVATPQFLAKMGDAAGVFLRNSPYKAAFQNAVVIIQPGRSNMANNQISSNSINGDYDDNFGKKKK